MAKRYFTVKAVPVFNFELWVLFLLNMESVWMWSLVKTEYIYLKNVDKNHSVFNSRFFVSHQKKKKSKNMSLIHQRNLGRFVQATFSTRPFCQNELHRRWDEVGLMSWNVVKEEKSFSNVKNSVRFIWTCHLSLKITPFVPDWFLLRQKCFCKRLWESHIQSGFKKTFCESKPCAESVASFASNSSNLSDVDHDPM